MKYILCISLFVFVFISCTKENIVPDLIPEPIDTIKPIEYDNYMRFKIDSCDFNLSGKYPIRIDNRFIVDLRTKECRNIWNDSTIKSTKDFVNYRFILERNSKSTSKALVRLTFKNDTIYLKDERSYTIMLCDTMMIINGI